jgi:quinol monooxygenase YgiN
MDLLRRALFLALLVMAAGPTGSAPAQPPAVPPIEGNVYSVIYVEVMPASISESLGALKRYRDATRKEDGNLRSELLQRLDERHQFVILEVWKDQAAFQSHGRGAASTEMREKIAAIRNAPTDERVHAGLAVGPIPAPAAAGAVYVVTHVDVIPPRKDDGIAAVKQLADDSRRADGNLRFEVVQQGNRPNHFTVVEVWKDAKAVEAHSMAAATRGFRDKLATMTGALYDERKYALRE